MDRLSAVAACMKEVEELQHHFHMHVFEKQSFGVAWDGLKPLYKCAAAACTNVVLPTAQHTAV